MILKYIILEDNNSPVIFENRILHSDIAKPFGRVKSAGFCRLSIGKNKIIIKCFGESSTLKIDSNPIEDEVLIKDSLFKPAKVENTNHKNIIRCKKEDTTLIGLE